MGNESLRPWLETRQTACSLAAGGTAISQHRPHPTDPDQRIKFM